MSIRFSSSFATLLLALTAVGCGDGSSSTEGAGGAGGDGSGGNAQTTSGAGGASTTSGLMAGSTTASGTTGTSVTTGAGGGATTGAGGGTSTSSGGGSGVCRPKFASGVNVAWFNFAGDVPNPNITKFDELFQNSVKAGGRVVRWWFHTNGTVTPGYDANGMAKKISDADIADVKKILDSAHKAGAAVDLSLWSFDMLQPNAMVANNTALLTKDANRQAYIDNVLTPLVTALKGHPGLYSYEIFNEPEGMTTENGWTPNKVSEAVIQRCVNWFADAIHAADADALVTNGAWTFKANADVDGFNNFYSDAALKAAGGKAGGTLDFYEVHYYDNWGAAGAANVVSPFINKASHWSLDKPIVMGEFWAIDTGTFKAANLYTTLYDNGYNGGWAWQYANADGSGPATPTKWPAMQVPMQNLYTAHKADLDCP